MVFKPIKAMIKRLLPCLLVSLLLVACKKDKKTVTPVTYSVIGNWTLYSYQTNFGIGVNATVTQYPCMGYNTLTFYTDSTSSQNYSGIDTCFITPTHIKADGAQNYGIPGLLPLASTWHQKGNTIYMTYPGNPQKVPGVINSANGKLQITFKDTITSGANTYYITSVEIQE